MKLQYIGILTGCMAIGTAMSAEQFVHTYELKNGIKLLIKEDHRAPVVVSQLWYKVGSSYEYDGITGVSHVLEHMMFKGTERFGPGKFSRVIAENGGKDNAFTSRDYTMYFQLLEKSRLAVSMEMEADRMRSLVLNEAEFRKELEVVKEERRMRTDDSPRSLTQEHFYSVAYSNNTYKNPIIGWISDLNEMTLPDLQEWYQKWYAPNNAVLVIGGDVDPKEVYELAEKYYGAIAKQVITPPKTRQEIAQLGMRQLTVRAPAQVPYLLMGYKVPVLKTVDKQNDWEPYALEVLAGILAGTRSARFDKILVRDKRIAVDADVGYNMHAHQADMFLIDGTPAQGKTADELKRAIIEQIERLKSELVTTAELDRIKAQVVAHDVYQKDSVFYQAMEVGVLETVGLGWKYAQEYLERIRKVTPEQIQQVTKKYLVDDHLTIAVLEPQPIVQQVKPSSVTSGLRH